MIFRYVLASGIRRSAVKFLSLIRTVAGSVIFLQIIEFTQEMSYTVYNKKLNERAN